MASPSAKDQDFRNLALYGSLWKVLLKVCLPLSLYAVLNFVFKILDTMMASHISAASVSTVAVRAGSRAGHRRRRADQQSLRRRRL